LSPGDFQLISEDRSFSVAVPEPLSRRLLAGNNAYGQNLRVNIEHESTVENDRILASYRVRVLDESGAAIDGFVFDEPVVLAFRYGEGSGIQGRLAVRAAATPGETDLNVFWHNGVEYIRVGGNRDDAGQQVMLRSTRPGEYQLRAVSRATVFALSSINPPKVFTPGIAPYEKIVFYVDNPGNDKVTGVILNLRGESVADLSPAGDSTAASVILEWDGRESDRSCAPKGVYMYQIKGSGKVINGTIVVAR
jgi:hypothetical protein